MGEGRCGCGGGVDGGSGDITDGGGGGDGWDSNKDRRIIRWAYTVVNVILGTEHNVPLASTPGLELYHPIMSMLGGHGGQLERYRDIISTS